MTWRGSKLFCVCVESEQVTLVVPACTVMWGRHIGKQTVGSVSASCMGFTVLLEMYHDLQRERNWHSIGKATRLSKW